MATIDKASALPFYQQIAGLLRQEIEHHVAAEGSYTLPSENDLCVRYGISRATVRHALDLLEREGRIYRQKGRGAFAVVRRVEQDLVGLVSTTEDMAQRGWNLTTVVVSLVKMPATPAIQQSLDLAGNEEVYELVRLRQSGATPLSLQTAYLPVRLCPRLEENDLGESLYRLLESRYNLRLCTGREVLRARGATEAEANALQLRPGEPVLAAHRVTWAANGLAVEYLEAVWRGDRYDFTVNLSRPTETHGNSW